MKPVLRAFIDGNRRLSNWLEKTLNLASEDLFSWYEAAVARRMNSRREQTVVDVGGGKRCPFAALRTAGARIIAVDVSAEELLHNGDVDEIRVANIMETLPFRDGEVDMIVSRSVLEHLANVEMFVQQSSAALRPGGSFIHLFPSRFAPFVIMNRALPAWLSRRLVHYFHPATVGINGFPAFYDRCDLTSIAALLDRHGFDLEEYRASYYQSRYFDFFFPAFAISALYDRLTRFLAAPQLAAYLLVVARRRGATGTIAS